MRYGKWYRCLFFSGCCLFAPWAQAGAAFLPTGGSFFSVPVKSLKDMRFQTVVKQEYDFSCGSAALATLLTYNYQDPKNETAVFKAMYAVGDKNKIQKEGFSMLDMKTYLEHHGYQANGYKASLDDLREAGVPAIALITVNGYKHFVVIKGVDRDHVLIGDPALGLRIVSRSDFQSTWNGILFVIVGEQHDAVAQKTFNQKTMWASVQGAPLGNALSRESLANFTLLLPGRNDR